MLHLVEYSGGLKRLFFFQEQNVSRVIGGEYLMRYTDGPGALL